jgi:hypothetical protein
MCARVHPPFTGENYLQTLPTFDDHMSLPVVRYRNSIVCLLHVLDQLDGSEENTNGGYNPGRNAFA